MPRPKAKNPSAGGLERYLARFSDRRIAVLGDFMLDEFVWGRATRISSEAPVPVVEVTDQTESPGGAGNVVANIVALGGQAIPFGVVGKDPTARRLGGLMRRLGVPVDGLVGETGRCTPLKTRIIELSRKHQLARTDRETRRPAPPVLLRRLARRLLSEADRFHAVIVSDYDKGTVTPELLAEVLPALESRGIPVFLDPRTRHPLSYRPITVMTPNESEAQRITGIEIGSDRDLESAGRRLLEMLECPYVLITRGERGMALFERGGDLRAIPTVAQEVYDVTGAGDTVIAALALAFASGATMGDAAAIANFAAGIAVAHVGTFAPDVAQLRAQLRAALRNARSK